MIFQRITHHYRKLDLSRQVAFRALVAFIFVFLFLRALTYVIHYQLLPIHNLVTNSGLHIHHLFWGILLLMLFAVGMPFWRGVLSDLFGKRKNECREASEWKVPS